MQSAGRQAAAGGISLSLLSVFCGGSTGDGSGIDIPGAGGICAAAGSVHGLFLPAGGDGHRGAGAAGDSEVDKRMAWEDFRASAGAAGDRGPSGGRQ